jgi:predicted MFS family arabinose efflux permease
MAPSALSILGATFGEGQERNRALGVFGAVGGSSASVGVIASGMLTGGPGWRWIFFINVPIGLALIAAIVRFLPADKPAAGRREYDVAGAGAVTASLLLFIYGLNRGATHGWRSGWEIVLFGAAAVLFALFARIESGAGAPLVPPAILRNRTMVAADLAAFLFTGGFYAFIFLGTLLFQQLLGYSPTRAGFAWLATSLTAFLAAALTGSRLASSVGIKRLLIAGGTLLALGAVLLTRVAADSSYFSELLLPLMLVGVAVGLAAPSMQIGALSGASGPTVGLASGVIETMREIGGAVGVAIVSTVLISHAGDDAASNQTALSGFRAAFVAIAIVAALGAVITLIAFPRAAKPAPARTGEPEIAFAETTSAD